MIRQGKWTRNHQHLNGQHCALGLINKTIPYSEKFPKDAAWELLDVAIPEEEFDALKQRVKAANGRRDQYMENDGYWRSDFRPTSRIASYNNTRPTEREVIAWFSDARDLLSETPSEEEERN